MKEHNLKPFKLKQGHIWNYRHVTVSSGLYNTPFYPSQPSLIITQVPFFLGHIVCVWGFLTNGLFTLEERLREPFCQERKRTGEGRKEHIQTEEAKPDLKKRGGEGGGGSCPCSVHVPFSQKWQQFSFLFPNSAISHLFFPLFTLFPSSFIKLWGGGKALHVPTTRILMTNPWL